MPQLVFAYIRVRKMRKLFGIIIMMGFGLLCILFLQNGESYMANKRGQILGNSQHYPVTVKTYDSSKQPIQMTFSSKPRRVVVDELNTMETLLALGLGDSIVETSVPSNSVSYQRLQREYPKEMAKLRAYTAHELNAESVLAVNPDFILGWKSTFTSVLKKPTEWWNERGIPTYIIATSNHILNYGTIDDECQFLEDMGKIFDVEEKTDALVKEIQDEIKSAKEEVKGKSKPKTMVIELSGRGLFMNYDDGWLVGDMVTSLGGYIPVKERRISYEGLLEQNPDVIFVVFFNDPQKKKIMDLFRQTQFSSLKAVQENRIYLLPFDCMYTSAIKTIRGLRMIKAGLYPELENFNKGVSDEKNF